MVTRAACVTAIHARGHTRVSSRNPLVFSVIYETASDGFSGSFRPWRDGGGGGPFARVERRWLKYTRTQRYTTGHTRPHTKRATLAFTAGVV